MELTSEEKKLIGKCGIFCGACTVYWGLISKPGKEVRKALNDWNFSDVAHLLASGEKYYYFKEMLNYFCDRLECKGCGSENTLVDCPIHECCEEKGIFSCAECQEFKDHIQKGESCSNDFMKEVSKRYSHWNIENLKKINEIGYRKFLQQIRARVDKGFCTGDVISQEPVFCQKKRPPWK